MQEPKKKFTNTQKNYLIGGIALIVIIFLIGLNSNTASDYQSKIDDYQSKITSYKQENEELNEKVEDAEPWFNMSEEEQQEIIDKQKEEQEAKEKAEKEKEKQEELEESRAGKTQVDIVNPETGESQKVYVNKDTLEYVKNLHRFDCPYCGGKETYIVDSNDYTEYCENCGFGLEE